MTGAGVAQDDAVWRSHVVINPRGVAAESDAALQLHRALGSDQAIVIRVSLEDAAGDAREAASGGRNNGRVAIKAGVAQELHILNIDLPGPGRRQCGIVRVAAEDDVAGIQSTIPRRNGHEKSIPGKGHIVQIKDGAGICDAYGPSIGWSDDAVTVAVDGELAGRKLQKLRARLDITGAKCTVGGHVEGCYGRIRIELRP